MKYFHLLALLLICTITFGCSRTEVVREDPVAREMFLEDGSILIARPLPKVSSSGLDSTFAFLPVPRSHPGMWLSISVAERSINLMDGENRVASSPGEGVENLKPGTYQLLHKQRTALWRAPDSYFQQRGMDVPPAGAKQRLLRGALGDYVMYLDKDTPIHTGPIWLNEIGGVRLAEDEMAKIYYSLPVNAPIEVR